jgi:hypothetical protein
VSTTVIYNSLQAASLDVIAVTDPSTILDVTARQVSSLSASVATQINDQRAAVNPSMTCIDLEQYIADIVIETTVQGSAFLEVHLIDPFWKTLLLGPDGVAFFDVSTDGYLWPPIVLDFPVDSTDQQWALCQMRLSTDMTQPNVILTFEDYIVAQCREHDNTTDPSLATSRPDETRAEFIQRCFKTAVPQGRFMPLLTVGSPDAFSPLDLAADEIANNPPKSVKKRKNPTKAAGVSDKARATASLTTGDNPRGTAVFTIAGAPTTSTVNPLAGVVQNGSTVSVAPGSLLNQTSLGLQ